LGEEKSVSISKSSSDDDFENLSLADQFLACLDQQKDDLAILKREFAAKDRLIEDLQRQAEGMRSSIRIIADERDELRKDAERYRWLIKSIPAQIGDGVCGCLAVSDEYIEEAIDAAIDAARVKP
jgi:hypothetical protein